MPHRLLYPVAGFSACHTHERPLMHLTTTPPRILYTIALNALPAPHEKNRSPAACTLHKAFLFGAFCPRRLLHSFHSSWVVDRAGHTPKRVQLSHVQHSLMLHPQVCTRLPPRGIRRLCNAACGQSPFAKSISLAVGYSSETWLEVLLSWHMLMRRCHQLGAVISSLLRATADLR